MSVLGDASDGGTGSVGWWLTPSLIFMTAVSHAIINFEGSRNCPDVFLYSYSSYSLTSTLLFFVQLEKYN
jgi:hypothetical protein